MVKKAIFILALIAGSAYACQKARNQVDYTEEKGVDIITNHSENNRSTKHKVFKLIQERIIDLSTAELVQHGLTDPAGFDVDTDGTIFVWNQLSNQNHIFRLDSEGHFISAFGRTGQGPGEIQFLTSLRLDNNSLLAIDTEQRKLVFYDKTGVFLEQRIMQTSLPAVIPLYKGYYITIDQSVAPGDYYSRIGINIVNHEFNLISEIGEWRYYRPNPEREFPAINPTGFIGYSKENIYFANSEDGYEVKCFDLSGKLKRVIRKDFVPVSVSKDYIEALREKYSRFPPEIASRIIYPKNLPPFQTGFADENGRLFVMTYEESDRRGNYWHDVFDKEGIFIGRVSISNYGTYGRSQGFLFSMAKNGHLYYLHEKPDGLKELVISTVK